MANINTGPQPVPVSGNVTVIPASSIDRNPGAVPIGTPQTPVPPAPISPSAIDRNPGAAPTPYQGGVTPSRATVTVTTTTVTPAANTTGGVIPSPPGALPIAVADDGSTLTTAVRSFNFVGDGVVATANTQNNAVTVTITGGNVINTYGNANVAAYLASGTDTSNIITTGNVRGSYILGNGSQLTGISNIGNLAIDGATITVKPGASDEEIFISPSGESWAFLQLPINDTANVTNTRLHNNAGNVEIGAGSLSIGAPTYEWVFDNNGTLNFPRSQASIYGGLDNDFTINTSNTGNATYTFTFSQFGDLSVPINLYVSGNVYTNDIVAYSGNVAITANTQSWLFATDGRLFLPNSGVINASGNSVDIGSDDAISLEASTVVNIYTDTNGNSYQWQFGDDGNLTLPTNTASINYANGSPYGGGSSSSFNLEYEVTEYVANTIPGFGEIQFADNEAGNSAPATAQKLFINTDALNEQVLGTVFQQWAQNSYRGTLTLNNGTDQVAFNISQGRVYFDPETYRGFQAGLNQIWGDDCSINQLIITNATTPRFYNTDFLTEDDVFHASALSTGNTHAMLNVYGSSQYNPINPNDLWNLFTSFVDNVLYDGETLRTDVDSIKTQFYANTGNFRGNIPTQDLFQYFRFTNSPGADYFGTAPTTTNGSGTGATVRVRVNANNTYTVLGTADPGVGYIGGETLTVAGTDLGGATPDNDLTIFINSVDGDGVITAVSYDSGTGVYPWPSNRISDGGDDQYDTGNYLNTNLAEEISYANGMPQTDSADFGGGDYCVMYDQSFFCLVTTGATIDSLFYSGNLGFDGDGLLNWTGLRSSQDVVANNNARYAYFDTNYLDGTLTIADGVTYNMTLDSAGIDLDEFYAYTNPDSNDQYFGSNTDWRLESQSQLYVQSYSDMFIQTLVNQRGTGESGPHININAAAGSPGQREINATAGNGGTVYVRGGNAGGSDGIDSLGNNGGDVVIEAGEATGNGTGGTVYISGGAQENGHTGNIRLSTYNGPVGNGRVEIYTTDGTERLWAFNANGTTEFPTLTVDLHNGGNQAGQVLQFGNITQQVIITGPTPEVDSNAQRLIIQGQRGNGTGEGGDVYLWGGDAEFNGGDIKIYAGDADNVASGSGGYVNIEGGSGFDSGGYVSMQGGQSNNGQGAYAQVVGGYGASGGDANVVGGQGYAGAGGAVNITGGVSGNGLAEYGNVTITAGASTWNFNNTGNLIVPGEGVIRSINDVIQLQSYDTSNSIARGLRVGTNGGMYLEIGNNQPWLSFTVDSGDAEIGAAPGVAGTGNAGYSLTLFGGPADTSAYGTGAGGNINLQAGLGATNDGGGGGPGGSINITAGNSYDPAGVPGNITVNTGSNTWTFDYTGNLTLSGNTFAVNYANGTQVSLGGGSYGDSNVATFLSSYGSNTISTTGNISGGNLIASANVLGNGYARFIGSFDESQASTAGLYLGYAGGTPRMMFGTGNTSQTFEIDNDSGNLRFYQPGSTKATLTSTGDLSTAGNITATGKIGYAGGGTVTQSGTGQGVTLNQLTGRITLAKSSWNPGDLEAFVVQCNKVSADDYILAQISGTNSTYFMVSAYYFTGTSFYVNVRALDTLSGAPNVKFFIMKAPIS